MLGLARPRGHTHMRRFANALRVGLPARSQLLPRHRCFAMASQGHSIFNSSAKTNNDSVGHGWPTGQRWLSAKSSKTANNTTGDSTDIVFALNNATKVLPGGRKLLDNVTLSFYKGAKIGIIGPNGAGKSSFLKLIAGEDKEHEGSVWVSDDIHLG